MSNDAWFEDSIEPWQHHTIARMRALESGRYLLRATNTGITAIIGPDGGVQVMAPPFERAVITATVRPMQGATPYVSAGDAPWLIFCISLLVFLAWRNYTR